MPCESCKSPAIVQGICKPCVKAMKELHAMQAVTGTAHAQYFERGQYVGERTFHVGAYFDGVNHFSAYWPFTAYFCSVCGEIWARQIYQFDFNYNAIPQTPWVIESRACVEHGSGLFLTGLSEYALDDCDKDLLTREFLALLQRS